MNTRTVRQKNKISNFTGGQQDFTSILGVHPLESPLILNCDICRLGSSFIKCMKRGLIGL